MNNAAPIVVTVALVALAGATHAATQESVASRVEDAARSVLLERAHSAELLQPAIEVHVVSNDALKPCAQRETTEPVDTRQASRMRFVAVCAAEPPFRTEFIVRGSITAEVVIATADVKANRPIEPAQLALVRREVPSGTQVLSDLDAVDGRSSRRALRNGQILDRRWLIEPVLVQRGANVTIVARNIGVEVNVAGIAVDAGRRGDIISVRNAATGKVIPARVIGENAVEPASGAMPAPQ